MMKLGTKTTTLLIFIVHISGLSAQFQYDSPQTQSNEKEISLELNKREKATGRIVAVVGDTANILCHNAGDRFDYCRFVIPEPRDSNGLKTLVLSNNFESQDPNIEYFGTGLQNGQCGIKIKNVADKYNGNFTCTAAVGPHELSGTISLLIAKPPLEPEIEQESLPSRNGYEVNQRLTWKCIVRDGRPPAQIRWFMQREDQYLPIDSINPNHHPETLEDPSSQLFTSVQRIEKVLKAEDDGNYLVCRAIHEPTGRISESKVQISVKFAPNALSETDIYGLQLDRSNTIAVVLKSNPRPRIEWRIDGNSIAERQKYDNFIVPEVIQVGPNLYNATLQISKLTVEDLTKTYYLSASNDVGKNDFTVRISSADTPAEGLEIGAIVGIVVALAILFVVVALIVFSRITGRWCFAPKSTKTENVNEGFSEIKVNKDSKKMPFFKNIFKNRNEEFKKLNQGSVTGEDQNQDEIKLDIRTNDAKNENQLCYAELMLKPSENTAHPPKNPSSTEYAEIMYVHAPPDENKKN